MKIRRRRDLPRQSREKVEALGDHLRQKIFVALDGAYGGEAAGRVATATQKAFERALAKELE